MVKPEKFGHLRLVYHFTVPLRNSISRPYETKMWVQFGSKMAKKAIFIPARSCSSCSFSLVSLEVFSPAQILLIVQTTAIRHSFFFLPYFLFSSPWNLKTFFLSSFCFFLCSTLSCFLFESAFLSFLFSYYSILCASSLCSITIQSVLFLLFVIF